MYLCIISNPKFMNSTLDSQTPQRSASLYARIVVHVAALICIIMWGLSFISTKVLLEHHMSSVEIIIYRFIIAYLVLLAISHKRFKSYSWHDEGMFVLCGLTSGSIYYMAENTALEYTLVANVSLLSALAPLITAALVGVMYKNEKLGKGMLVGSLLAFIGVGFVIYNSQTASGEGLQINPLGDMLALSAALCWAVYTLVLRRVEANYDIWFVTRKTFFYELLTTLPFLLVSPHMQSPAELFSDMSVIYNLVFLSLGPSLLAFIIWANTVKVLGAIKANNYMYLQPVITMIAAAFMFANEPITIYGVVGCALILGGLWIGEKIKK